MIEEFLKVHLYIYIYLLFLSVCLFPLNVKKTEPIGSKVCVGPRITLSRLINAQNYKKLYPKAFYFSKI